MPPPPDTTAPARQPKPDNVTLIFAVDAMNSAIKWLLDDGRIAWADEIARIRNEAEKAGGRRRP